MAQSLMPMSVCFCGSKPERQERPHVCSREDCPRDKLGYGSWHRALPKLQQLSASELKRMYPLLNLRDLEIHVKREGRRHYERKAARAAATTLPLRYRSRTPVKLRGRSHTPTKRAYEKCHLQEADHVKSSRHEAIPSSSSRRK